MSEATSSSSLGAAGGAKKLKNDSVGTVFLMTRVCFVSVQLSAISSCWWGRLAHSCFSASCSQL
jgi:hypothetical protein